MLYPQAPEHSRQGGAFVNAQRLRHIINQTTKAFPVTNDAAATAHFGWVRTIDRTLPKELNIVWVDCYFHQIAVDEVIAMPLREEVVTILQEWPDAVNDMPITPLIGLPTYADMSAVLDEHSAFGLLALGAAVELWGVNTPVDYGYVAGTPNAANAARIGGALRINCYKP